MKARVKAVLKSLIHKQKTLRFRASVIDRLYFGSFVGNVPGGNVLLYKQLVKEACSLGVNILLQKTNN